MPALSRRARSALVALCLVVPPAGGLAQGGPPSSPGDLLPPPPAPGAAPATPAARKAAPWSFGAWGALPSGEHLATAITPRGASYQINEPESSYSFGLVLDYAVTPEIHAFLDGGLYSQGVDVAEAGGYASSFWVYEQTGYTSHDIGPFDTDVRYFMDTTAIRLGARYVLRLGSLEAYAGATLGVYAWTATYGTPDRKSKYGQDTGTVTGTTFLLGADLPIAGQFTLGVYADLASPAADVEIQNLFRDGWTWRTGHHVMGPYRWGFRLMASM